MLDPGSAVEVPVVLWTAEETAVRCQCCVVSVVQRRHCERINIGVIRAAVGLTRMAASKLSYQKTVACARYKLDSELYFNGQPKVVLPWFSSVYNPDLKWAIELRKSEFENKKEVFVILDRGSWKKKVIAAVRVDVTHNIDADDLGSHCKTTETERRPKDFSLYYNGFFKTFREQEKSVGTFYTLPKLQKSVLIYAYIQVTDGTIKEIVERTVRDAQVQASTEPSRELEHQKALSGSFSKLLDSGELSDVTIRVEGRTIPAHRCVLAARSDVFKAMFTSKFKEQSVRVVDIKDVAFNVAELLLRFMYTGAVDIDDNLLVELLMCADKYMVQDLSTLCRDRLAVNLQKGGNVAQACEMLLVAHLLDSKTLRDIAIEYCKRRKFIFLSCEGWKKFSKSHRSVAAAACLDVMNEESDEESEEDEESIVY